jgi:hypothetical protein
MELPIPPRIASLPVDSRGYPIPWNVLRNAAGEVFFTVNDDRKAWEALRRQLCPICGERLGKWKWFVGGPRSAFDEHGWYLDLPGHHECMQYALTICPYLAAPKYLGRIDVVHPEKLPPEADILLDETMISDRPEVFVAVASDAIEAKPGRPGVMPYVRPMRPVLAYEFWRHGEQIPLHRAMPVLRGLFGAEWTVPAVKEED